MSVDSRINRMKTGGAKLGQVRDQVVAAVVPGMSLAEVDALADKLIAAAGGEPGFKLVPGYHWATCINLNEGVVHGIPHPHIKIKSGDLVSLDVGMFYQGYHTDTSTTFAAGAPTSAQAAFLAAGRRSLTQAIHQARPGNHVGDISQAMQRVIEHAGYNCVRNLTGHGIGTSLHQPPMIPCLQTGAIHHTPRLTRGMTLAIEVIYTYGHWQTEKLSDSWTIVTRDRSPAAIFEATVLITQQGPLILT